MSGLSTSAVADTLPIDRSTAIKKALRNLPEILVQTNVVKKAQSDYYNSFNNKANVEAILSMDDRLDELQYKDGLTNEEELELQFLCAVLKTSLSNDEVYNLTISSETAVDNAAYILELNSASLQTLKNNILLNINSLINNLSKLDKTILLKKEMIQNLELSYNKSVLKYNLGKLSQTDLKQQYINLQKERIQANNLGYQREIVANNIHKAIGEIPTIHYDGFTHDEKLDLDIKGLDTYLNTAISQRRDIINAKRFYDMQQRVYKITQRFYPWTTDISNMDATLNLEDAKNTLDSMTLEIQEEVQDAYKDTQNKLNNMIAAEYRKNINEAKYNEMLSRYNLGSLTDIELSNAYINYCNSKIEYTYSQYDLYQSKLVLLNACGYDLLKVEGDYNE